MELLIFQKPISKDKFESFVLDWNRVLPFDKFYRDFYKIPIFSEDHLNTSFFSMICFCNEKMIERKNNIIEKKKNSKEEEKKKIEQMILNDRKRENS